MSTTQQRPVSKTVWALLCMIHLTTLAAPLAAAEKNGFDLRNSAVPVEEILQGGPPRDGIPAIDRPKFVTAAEARFLAADARVLGVFRHGIAKAYPIAILNWHEVVNDRFGPDPIAVTYCPLCGTGMAFLAQANGQPLQFGVSGLLYNSDVLLYDRQSSSLWSQIASKAVTGTMKGHTLTDVALSNTTWSDWRRRHPGTLVLSPETGHAREYGRDPYEGYARDERLFFAVRETSQRYHPKELVLGVRLGQSVKAYPFVELAKTSGALADQIGSRRITVRFDPAHRTAHVVDEAGREIPTIVSYWFAWYAFHPKTAVFVAQPGG